MAATVTITTINSGEKYFTKHIAITGDAAGEVIGNIWLVWGNDEDVISDHSDSEAMADFMAGRY
jgi:hypothetical protein